MERERTDAHDDDDEAATKTATTANFVLRIVSSTAHSERRQKTQLRTVFVSLSHLAAASAPNQLSPMSTICNHKLNGDKPAEKCESFSAKSKFVGARNGEMFTFFLQMSSNLKAEKLPLGNDDDDDAGVKPRRRSIGF